MPVIHRLSLLSLLVLAAPHAGAESLADCRRIADAGQRLACYDGLDKEIPPEKPPAATSTVANLKPPAAAPQESSDSLLGKAWELDPGERGHILRIRPYKPVYALPLFHATNANRKPSSPAAGHSSEDVDLSSNEAKLQISLKTKLYEDLFGSNGDLWFGYTQSSRWQVYTSAIHGPSARPTTSRKRCWSGAPTTTWPAGGRVTSRSASITSRTAARCRCHAAGTG